MVYVHGSVSKQLTEAAMRRCSRKISQNPQENTCDRVFFNKVAGLKQPYLQNTSGRLSLNLKCFLKIMSYLLIIICDVLIKSWNFVKFSKKTAPQWLFPCEFYQNFSEQLFHRAQINTVTFEDC